MKKTSIAPIIIAFIITGLIIVLIVFYPQYAKSTVLKPLIKLIIHILD